MSALFGPTPGVAPAYYPAYSAPVAATPAPVGQTLLAQHDQAWALDMAFTQAAPTYAAPVAPSPLNAQIALLQQQLQSLQAASYGISGFVPVAPAAPVQATSLMGDLQYLFQQAMNAIKGWVPPAPTPGPAPSPTQPPAAPPPSNGRSTQFTISSFNVLGSSHTRPGGNKPGMDSGVVRIRRAAELLKQHSVEIAGMQEFQPDQRREFKRVAGKDYAVYPDNQLGTKHGVNSIVYRKDTWDMVKPGFIEIPYFQGQPIKMPVIRLRHKVTGQEAYFANFHNPASTKRVGDQQRWRTLATTKQIDMANRLMRESGIPVFVVGDMNEREEYYNRMTQGAPMVASNTGPGGKPPKQMGIDWIFGTKGVQFSNHVRDRSAYVQRTTDHPMIVSEARIGPR